MADMNKTVEILFAGVDQTKGVFSDINKNFDSLSRNVEDVAQPLSNVADSVLGLDAALAGMAAAGLAVAVNQAGKFGDSFKEISTLIDDTGQGVDQFRTDILAYSRDSSKSIEDIESAIYTAISAGTDYKESLALLSDSEKLSIATKSELEASTKLLASTLNAYGVSTDEAAKYSDILFTTVKNGQTTFPELSNSLASVLNIAANSGVPFEVLSSAIAAVTATGAPTSQAIDSIKSALGNIIKPSQQATELANELGLEFNATALKTKGFEEILQDVNTATDGSVEKLAVLFGDVNGLSAAMTLGADASGKFKDSLSAMADSAGATEAAYRKMVDSFKDTNQNLANNVKATFIQIGTELQTNYSDIVKKISETFKSLGVSIDQGAFDDIFDALDGVGGDITKFFAELAESLPEALEGIDWTGLLRELDELGSSIASLFSDFDPSDPESVRNAIQFVVESIKSLITVTKGMVDSFKPMKDAILNSIEAFNRMNDADKEATGNVLALAKALTTLGSGLTTLLLMIGDNADKIESAFNVIIGSIQTAWGGFKSGLQVISVAILESIDTVLAAAEKVTFGDWGEDIKTARSGIQQELDGLYQRLNQSVGEVHSGWDQIVDGVSQGVDQVKRRYADLNDADALSVEPVFETRTFEENLALVQKKMEEFKASGGEVEVVLTNDEAIGAISEVVRKWDALSLSSTAKFNVLTNFKEVQSDWDALNTEIGVGGGGPSIEFKTVYKWTDADGGTHLTDTPPDPGEAVGDVEEIKTPIGAKVNKDSVRDAQNAIKSAFSSASIGGVNIDVQVDGVGVGPQGSPMGDYFKDQLTNMEPVDINELLDPGGLADLVDAFNNTDNLRMRHQIEEAIREQIRIQRDMARAQKSLLDTQRAIAQQQWEAAYMTKMAAEMDRTINLELEGVEPEIEAFIWKIFKKIQARANASGAEFLLAAAD